MRATESEASSPREETALCGERAAGDMAGDMAGLLLVWDGAGRADGGTYLGMAPYTMGWGEMDAVDEVEVTAEGRGPLRKLRTMAPVVLERTSWGWDGENGRGRAATVP